MSPRRAEDALTWALHLGVVDGQEVAEPRELAFSTAERVHTPDYLGKLDQRDTVASIVGTDPETTTVGALLETWRRAAGGTVEAAQWALEAGGRAVNLLGGFHHAAPSRGAGFCALNDIAIAVAEVRAQGTTGPIAIIDLDAHPPDGIVEALPDDPELTVLSLSVASEWAVESGGVTTVVDARVPPGTDTVPYLEAVRELLKRLPEKPVLAFYLAGADPLEGDPLGGLAVSEEGMRVRDRRVLRMLGDVPTVVLPGGGYRMGSWRVHAGTIAEVAGVSWPIAASYDPVKRRTREIMRTLDPSQLNDDDQDVLITEAELFGNLSVAPRPVDRVLGFYTRHGLEYALNAYGYWPLLERMGFESLRIEVTHDQGRDHIRITAEVEGEAQPLFDLICRIRRLRTYQVLFIDWLELQDPRVTFSSTRPRLPGQQRPGLGLGEETTQLLIRAGERLGLDGVAFIPAFYHIAWMARRHFVVLDPELRGRFRALVEGLRNVPLVEASAALHEQGWPIIDGDPLRWTPTEMMIPVSELAREALRSEDPQVEELRKVWLERIQRPD